MSLQKEDKQQINLFEAQETNVKVDTEQPIAGVRDFTQFNNQLINFNNLEKGYLDNEITKATNTTPSVLPSQNSFERI